ncbi:MAG: Glu/Leu/Phe/Val dehydrogenase family protein, partial [bacterium]
RQGLYAWFGKLVESLRGEYVTCEDVGSTPEDMDIVRSHTSHVVGVSTSKGGYGDPSPFTAKGVFYSLEHVVKHELGRELDGLVVGIKGLGAVGGNVARILHSKGCNLILADIVEGRANTLATELSERVKVVDPNIVSLQAMDIYCPCALGGDINEDFVKNANCLAVVGAANNQLSSFDIGDDLAKRGIVYGPDYIVNAGGLILMVAELNKWSNEEVERRIANIPSTLSTVLAGARNASVSPAKFANVFADQKSNAN